MRAVRNATRRRWLLEKGRLPLNTSRRRRAGDPSIGLTGTDSAGLIEQYGTGKYRLTRLDATTFLPGNPTPSSVDLNIVSVQAALAATVGLNLDLEDAVTLNLATYGNMLGDTESTVPFGLRVTGLSTGRTRFAGTLYAARQDDETVQASGQLAYSVCS